MGYDVLVADPPWSYGKVTESRVHAHRGRMLGGHYLPMSLEQIIKETPMDPAPTAALFLWATNPKILLAHEAMRAWGFEYKTTITWVKVAKDGTVIRNGIGWFFRGATEHILLGTRGGFKIPASIREPNVLMAPPTEHSEKPQAFYDMVDRVSPAGSRKIDIYARVRRPGWDAWGDQLRDPPSVQPTSTTMPDPGTGPSLLDSLVMSEVE